MAKKRRIGNLFQRGNVWWLKYQVDGNLVRQSLETTDKATAEEKRKIIMAPMMASNRVDALTVVKRQLEDAKENATAADDTAHPPLTISKTWLAFVKSPRRPDSGPATLRGYEDKFQRFADWMVENHPDTKALRDVTPDMADQFTRYLTDLRLAPGTFNQYRNIMRLVWKVMATDARIILNPWDGIAPLKLQADAFRKSALTPGQFEDLLLAAEPTPELHDLLVILGWTGLRLIDGCLMKWSAIDFQHDVLTITPHKTARRTGKKVHIPMFPAVREVLDRRQHGRVINAKAFVFPSLAAEYQREPTAVSKIITATFEKAGMQPTEQRADRQRATVVFGAHALRHHFISAAAAAGMPSAVIRSITGHTSDSMVEHYQHIGASMASEIAKRIGKQPAALPAHNTDIREKVRTLAESLNAETWEAIKAELLKVAEGGGKA